jgi:DNA helicase-2/ATP-dependent DNA helicase PcrA
MYEVISRADEFVALGKNADKLASFVRLIEGVKAEYTLPSEIISALFERSGYAEMLAAEGFEGESKTENVKEFIGAAVEYESRCATMGISADMTGFLEEISLVTDVDKYDENADAVVLMTVHAAKGLEFPVVFIAGMEDGIFPSEQDSGDPIGMSEARRLAYVAITRAKEQLIITAARSRTMYGKTVYNRLSSFVREEIPEQLIEIDRPKSAPPKSTETSYRRPVSNFRRESPSSEWSRRPDVLKNTSPASPKNFGITRIEPGSSVEHATFGRGTVLAAKDMGGDILYTVRFENGQEKRLMATFAKLKKL